MHILGSTTPNAVVTIRGENTSVAFAKISKTITADNQGIFKTSFATPSGVYFFTIFAGKDGVKSQEVTFTANVLADTTMTLSDIEIPFPQEINGKPEECERKPDLNGDGKVDLIDFSILLSQWRMFDCKADLDKSGRVDLKDLSILLKAWTK